MGGPASTYSRNADYAHGDPRSRILAQDPRLPSSPKPAATVYPVPFRRPLTTLPRCLAVYSVDAVTARGMVSEPAAMFGNTACAYVRKPPVL